MLPAKTLIHELRIGTFDTSLSRLYALDGTQVSLDRARDRAIRTVNSFLEHFPEAESACGLFSGPGRTEIGGNHTDHQHGHVLCGSVDMDILACAAPNGTHLVRIYSDGYPALEIDLHDLAPKKEEENTSAALVRGVAARISELGCTLSGFDAYASSTVLSGSGLSSSAAYETLVGNIFNHLCCGDKLDPITIAKVGQYAENVYFGKPCGLMDQTGCSVGGVVTIDFADPAAPVVEKVDFDFTGAGYALCIIDSGADHADLTDEYAAVPAEMGTVCAHFGKSVLRDVPVLDFFAALPELRKKCGDRAVLRALHFYDDDRRVCRQVSALRQGKFGTFLDLINESGLSSWRYLQNIVPAGRTRHQEVAFALALAERMLDTAGACRVHGGGFAGTIQAFVPLEMVDNFKTGMERVLGEGSCHVLHLRPEGGCVVAG